MRFLLISDTHGNLEIINELAVHTKSDAVIHAGDFGFYDNDSYERLSDRELRLQITHSALSRKEKDRVLKLPMPDKIKAAREYNLLGEFPFYMDGEEHFAVPVYTVWGNHEDKDVVKKLFSGNIKVMNLYILHHLATYSVGPALIYGLGGNLLPGSKFFQKPIAGGGGRVWSTLSQYEDLVETIEKDSDHSGPRIFVAHVSPGKEPFIELIGARTRADYTISGHMGAPACMVWNPFAISSVEEATKRLQEGLDVIKDAAEKSRRVDHKLVEQKLSFISRLPEEQVHIGRAPKAPRWYQRMTHVNLPDAHVGYAVLDISEIGKALQTFVR
jgi:predicted phosphodiesterase